MGNIAEDTTEDGEQEYWDHLAGRCSDEAECPYCYEEAVKKAKKQGRHERMLIDPETYLRSFVVSLAIRQMNLDRLAKGGDKMRILEEISQMETILARMREFIDGTL